jgi:hypothetical protein
MDCSSRELSFITPNLQDIMQNATQIFHTNHRKHPDLNLAYAADTAQKAPSGDDHLSQEAQENSTLMF